MILKKLQTLEKLISSELSSKIKNSSINHEELLIEIEEKDLIDVIQFLKSNENCKFRQLIDVAGVDYPENDRRFELVYLLLSHEHEIWKNQLYIQTYLINWLPGMYKTSKCSAINELFKKYLL